MSKEEIDKRELSDTVKQAIKYPIQEMNLRIRAILGDYYPILTDEKIQSYRTLILSKLKEHNPVSNLEVCGGSLKEAREKYEAKLGYPNQQIYLRMIECFRVAKTMEREGLIEVVYIHGRNYFRFKKVDKK